MIKTKRLTIRLTSDPEMRAMIAEEPDQETKQAYVEMLDACIANPSLRHWYGAWIISLDSGERIGDLCFKGLSPEGVVEIGYGFLPAFYGKGYATESVIAMVDWASRQPGVKAIEAETDPHNIASRRVLQKAGFVPTGVWGEEGPRFTWQGNML